ncbi:MAG: GDP-mannose 4,6-dehydratase [Nitrososphaerales archaeon]
MPNLNVLVTGASGFIGRHITSYLSKRGFNVYTTDLRGADVNGDLSNREFVLQVLGKLDFDAVVHLAAITDIKLSLQDPYGTYLVNDFGTLNILDAAASKGVERFIYASSANVYGLPLELPVKEETSFNPRTPYDFSKVIGEYLVRSYVMHKGLKATVLRSWKIFGEYERLTAAIPNFIRCCLQGVDIPLYNGGADTTDPYYVENYAKAVELCLLNPQAIGEVFNVGTGAERSIRQVAEEVKRLTNSDSKLLILPPRSDAEREPMRSYPDVSKIKKKLGYEPMVSFEEGLKKTISWVKEVIG